MKFIIKQREVVYRGRAFDVQRIKALLPDGKMSVLDLVQHNPSISMIPLTEKGELLFVRQYRVGSESELMELPAGVLADGEDPLEGARRELREETGMDCRELVYLGQAYLAPGYANELMSFYLARHLFAAPLEQDEDEFLHLEAIPVKQAYAMARRGEIPDSKTLAALFLAEKYLIG